LEYSKVLESTFCLNCRVFCLNDPATKGHIDLAFYKKRILKIGIEQMNELSKGHQYIVSTWNN